MLQQFIELPVPLPPMLPGMIGINNTQYFSIYYQGSKATWNNGRGLGTFNYYAVYQTLISHITLAIHLERYNLGSDDELAEHAILCDCVRHKMYRGEYGEINYFLQQQHSKEQHRILSAEGLETAIKAVENLSIEQMQRMGMFEMFGSSNEQMRQETAEMVNWLDQYISDVDRRFKDRLIERLITHITVSNDV
jgi:hypothetical protein